METFATLEAIRATMRDRTRFKALKTILLGREQYLNASECGIASKRKFFFQHFPEARVRSIHPWGVTLEAPTMKHLPLPPAGYGYKGGAARLALQTALGLPHHRQRIRDLDLIRVTLRVDSIDNSMAKKLSPDDARYGFGVECISDFQQYLTSRDLTINEGIVFQDRVIASHQAISDTKERILRMTQYAKSQNQESQNRIIAKMLRLSAEAVYYGEDSYSLDLPPTSELSLFAFLLHLERTLNEKKKLSELFIGAVSERGILPKELMQATNLHHTVKLLRNLPSSQTRQFPLLSQLINSKQEKGKKVIRL